MNLNRDHPFLSRTFAYIGHRGAAGHAPENSLEAFEIAFAAGVDAIECDVKFVQGRILVFHDDTVDRMTGASGPIDRLTQSEISRLRLKNGEPVPALEDVWDITPPSVGINIELKGKGTAGPVADFIRSHSHRYIVSSFYTKELASFKSLVPEVPTALLIREHDENVNSLATSLKVDNIHVMDAVATPSYLKEIQAAAFTVYVFTVNTTARANELRGLGVAAVFTDVPRELNALTGIDLNAH